MLNTQTLRQASVLAVMGGSAYALRYFKGLRALPMHDSVARTHHLKHHRALVVALNGIEQLRQTNTFELLVEQLDRVLQLSVEAERQQRDSVMIGSCVNAEVNSAMRTMELLITQAKRGADDAILETCVECAEEHVPSIVSVLESIVHNAILDTCHSHIE